MSYMTRWRGIGGVTLAAVIALPAMANLIYSTGFESSDHAEYVAGQRLGGFHGWTPVLYSSGSTRDGDGVTVDSMARSGSQAGHVRGLIDSENTTSVTRLNLVLPQNTPASGLATGQFVRYEISIAVANADASMNMYTSYRTGWSASYMGVSLLIEGNGRVRATTGGNVTEIGTLEPGTFYDYVFDLHFNAAEPYYTVQIKDPTGTATWDSPLFPFRSSAEGLEVLNFQIGNLNDGAFLDDIRVSIIPEPGTLALLGAAGAALAAARRFRRA